jgi:translocator protein
MSWLRDPLVVQIATAAFLACAGAALGGIATDTGRWFRQLDKPSWQPPDWVFGPVWTTIFALGTASAVLAWRAAPGPDAKTLIAFLFALNLGLNILWSALFFKLRRPDWALGEVVLLWLSIVALIVGLWPISPVAAFLHLPYLAWVSTASFLNLRIVQLNRPFAAQGNAP